MSKKLKTADDMLSAFDLEIGAQQETRDSAIKLHDRRRGGENVEFLMKLRERFFAASKP